MYHTNFFVVVSFFAHTKKKKFCFFVVVRPKRAIAKDYIYALICDFDDDAFWVDSRHHQHRDDDDDDDDDIGEARRDDDGTTPSAAAIVVVVVECHREDASWGRRFGACAADKKRRVRRGTGGGSSVDIRDEGRRRRREREREERERKGENKRSNAGAETHSSVRDTDDGIPTRTRTAVDGGRFSVRFAQLERGDESRRGERSEMPTAREPAVAEIL